MISASIGLKYKNRTLQIYFYCIFYYFLHKYTFKQLAIKLLLKHTIIYLTFVFIVLRYFGNLTGSYERILTIKIE